MIQIVQFDYALLRGRIREIFQTEKKFAEAMRKSKVKMSVVAFSNKINGKTNFTQPEIIVMCELLNIPAEDTHIYFFKRKYELNS